MPRERRLVVDLVKPVAQAKQAALKRQIVREGGKVLNWESRRLSIAYTQRSALIKLNRLLLSKLDVADFNLERVEVEEIVREIYQTQGRERAKA